MQHHTFVCRALRIYQLSAAVIVLISLTAGAQTLTWDASTASGGLQNGNGFWNTSNTNWLDSTSANTSWVNSTTAIADIGGGVITTTGTSTAPTTITVQTDIQLTTLNFRGFTTTPTSYNIYTLQGDVAGRIIDFGTNGLIQMENLSSGGSQFVQLGSNLRLKANNLRIQKYGSGTTFQYITLGMATNPDLTGTLTIAGSIYATLGAPNTVQNVSGIVVEAGGSVVLGGTNVNYTQSFSLAGYGNSLTFSGTSYGAIRFTSNNTIVSGGITLTADAGVHTNFSGAFGTTGILINSAITDGGNNYGFTRFAFTRGDGTLTLAAANTYGGATTLGRALSTYSGGVTILDFTAATSPQNDILYNGLTTPGNLNFIGGNSVSVLRLMGKDGQTDSQRLGNVTVSGTHSSLELYSGVGGSVNLSFGAITHTDVNATLAVIAPTSGVITTTQADGFVGPWLTYTGGNGSRSWALPAGGLLGNSYAGDIFYTTGSSLSSSPFAATSNVGITSSSTGALTLGSGTTYLNTLSMADITTNRQISLGTGQTLRLGTQGGIQLVNGARSLTVGTAGLTSTLSAGGTVTNTAGQLFLTNNSSTELLTINSNLANNGTGIVTLVINGAPGSRTVLTGTNAHTGGTQISSGILEARSNGALGTSGTVTVVDGATLALSGGVTISRALAAIGGFGDANNGAIRSLSGDNFITGSISQNAMFMIAADAAASLTIQASSIISYSSVITFGGAGTVTVNAALTGAGAISKIGTGTLIFGGNNTYTGSTTISSGTLKLASTAAGGATTGFLITAGGTVDLNGQTTDRSFISINGAGVGSFGALINSSGTTAVVTGTTALATSASIGGSGNITISNSTGITGNVLLTKTGSGTLTVIDSTTTSARTGTTQIDAGTLRLQATAASIAPVGTGSFALNGGTLSLGFDATTAFTNVVNLLKDSTIIADRATSGAGGTITTLSTLTVGTNTLTVKPGDNVTSGTIGLTLGAVSIGGVSMRPGNPTFDVQSSATATLTLTLGAFTDQGISPSTITFQNSGTAASTITLGAGATSLVDGTKVDLADTGGALTLNLNVASGLGTLAQVTVASGNTLSLGAAQTFGSLAGSGTVTATGTFILTVGNALSYTLPDTHFSGVLSNGTGTLALTKLGLGTLTLDGSDSNTYTGATTVSSGTLVLAKTGGAIAISGGVLTIGNSASGTAGNATLRLGASDQAAPLLTALTLNAGSTLDLNGFNLTVLTLSSSFGTSITGSGTLTINQTGGTMTFFGVSTISSSSTLQLTGNGVAAARTMAITNVTDQLTISGNVTQGTNMGSIVAGNATQTALGTLILAGDNSYTGSTTVSSGILNIRSANALGSTVGTTSVTNGGTLQIQGGITTAAEKLTLNGGSGFAGSNGIHIQTGAFVNVSGVNNFTGLLTLATSAVTIASDSGILNLTNTGTITGAGIGLILAGAGDGSISSIIGTTTGSVTKNGTGTWTLKGVNTSTGAIWINAGTLKLGDGTTGSWTPLAVPGLIYTGSGVFEYVGATAASTQALGALTLTSGSGVLKVDAPASGTNDLTFTSLSVPALGSGLNIVSPANTSVTITGSTNTNGIIDPRITYNGADFASSTAGLIGAAATITATSSLTAGNLNPYLISGSFAQTTSATVNAGLKFFGGDTLTISSGTLLSINNGANTAGGILVTGGVTAVIANGGSATGLTTAGSGDLVIGTDAAGDSLSIQVAITSTTTGGLTKNGAGTLTLTVANAYTGATSINAGTLILGNASAMSSSVATVQVGAVLDLNGKIIINTATLNGTGISNGGALINNSVTNASIGALTIGLGNGTGGIGASIGGTGNITSTGVLTGNNVLVKTGSGTLTLGNNGGTALASTRTATTRIDAGTLRISNSTSAIGAVSSAIILNGGTLSLGSTASVLAYPVSVTASSTIVSDVFTAGAGLTHTLGVLAIGAQTLTIQAGSNVTTASTNAGITFGATTLLDNPTFDVQSPTTSTNGITTLTLGALNDQGVAKTITFANTGTSTTNSNVTLTTAMASLVDGTVVKINSGTNAGVTLNLNVATVLGTLAQVTVNGNSVINLGAAQTFGSLAGSGTITTSGVFTLTVGNANSSTPLSPTFTGTLSNGTGTLALTKNGLGTLTLAPTASAYTGATIVSAGILKLGNSTALGTTSGVTISTGATVDLNGQSTDRNFISISGTGLNGGGALTNSSSALGTITGTVVQGSYAKIGGTGDILINNAGGITGNALLTKFGANTLTVTSVTASARSGTNQIDEGILRLQALTAMTVVGTGSMAMNGGTLSLGFDTSGTVGGAVNILADSTIIIDRATAGAGSTTLALGAVIIGGNTLTVKAGSNVTSGTIGLTLTTITIGGPSLAPGNPTFDVQSTASANATLTLGALTDQAIAPRTITIQNSGTGASSVILATAASSLVDGTQINLAGTGGAITLNLNNASAIGTFAQVTMAAGNTLVLGASQTINSLNGDGTVTATSNSVLTIGNLLSQTTLNSTFNGALTGTNLSVVKAGTGTLTLGGSTGNTFSGSSGLTVNSGKLVLAKTGGAVAVSSKLIIGTAGAAYGSATVQLAGASQISTSATVTMYAQSFLDLNGYNATFGALNVTPDGTIFNNATGTATTLTVGAGDTTGQILGSIVDNTSGTGTVALTKTGSGAYVLGGYNTYSGATLVEAGSLQVGLTGMGTTGTGAVTVQNGATILGTGMIQGPSFTAASGSTVQAGDGTAQGNYGTLTFQPGSGSGTIDFQSGSTIILGLNPSGNSDLLNVVGTGSTTFLFNGNLTVTATAFTPTAPAVFNLLDWSGLTSSPTFDSRYSYTGMLYGNGDEASGFDLPDIAGSGYTWDISNFTTNGTIAIVLVPEPSRWMLLGICLGMLMFRRRR
ncbi:MAG: autotransporter-associated beta strand repeat-containing protein [Prosthecobacter sp.]